MLLHHLLRRSRHSRSHDLRLHTVPPGLHTRRTLLRLHGDLSNMFGAEAADMGGIADKDFRIVCRSDVQWRIVWVAAGDGYFPLHNCGDPVVGFGCGGDMFGTLLLI